MNVKSKIAAVQTQYVRILMEVTLVSASLDIQGMARLAKVQYRLVIGSVCESFWRHTSSIYELYFGK